MCVRAGCLAGPGGGAKGRRPGETTGCSATHDSAVSLSAGTGRTKGYLHAKHGPALRLVACRLLAAPADLGAGALPGQTGVIRKLKSGQYRLYSRKIDPRTGRRRNLGTFGTRAAAEKHERAVQYFKRRR